MASGASEEGVTVGGTCVGVMVAVGKSVAVTGTVVPVAGDAQDVMSTTSASKTVDLRLLNIIELLVLVNGANPRDRS